MKEKNKKTQLLLVIAALFIVVIVTTATSFAFFTYTRTSTQATTIRTGNLEFAMIDGTSVSLTQQFPQTDENGNKNTPYTFTVKNNSSKTNLYYKVSIVTNNDGFAKKFANDQIKIALTKNDVYRVGSSTTGVKVSEYIANDATEGVVVPLEVVEAGNTDSFALKMWISSDVDYTGTIDENGLMVGTLNDAQYSLKVKVDAVDEQ